jgi:glyoxylase-like metal-dependent hydrolase (beta-lactamase superfamily II)
MARDAFESTPYGDVSIRFCLQQVPAKPVYFVIGRSAVPDLENQGHTSNAGFVVTPEGVLVYDALGTPALGYLLLQRIREVTDAPVKTVVAGHYHADHIYGLQAFREHTDAVIWAQETAREYFDPRTYGASEDARRRLEQRRDALFPWVDESTYVVHPDQTFGARRVLELGGVHFELVHQGPAHSPSDSVMIVREHNVVFSGDLIYTGRVPFLDNPAVDSSNWLEGLDYLEGLRPEPEFVIPGHGRAFADAREGIEFTRGYILHLRRNMGAAVEDFIAFEQAYERTDWSAYRDLPAFEAVNRGNAYIVYLEMEAESLSAQARP